MATVERMLVEGVLELLLMLELLVDTSVDQVELGNDGAKVKLLLLLVARVVDNVLELLLVGTTLLLGVGSGCVCSPSSVHVVELEVTGATIAVDDVDGELLGRVVATLVEDTDVVR